MFKYSFLILLFIVTACNTTNKVDHVNENYHSLLWRIEKPGITKTPSWIFGTIHLIPKDQYFFTPKMQAAFNASAELVLELDMNELQDMSKMLEIMQLAMMPSDTSLSDLVSPEDYERIKSKFASSGMGIELFLDKIKPLFIAGVAGLGDDSGSLQDGKMVSYEMELTTMANEQSKKVSGLESVNEQFSAIDKIPLNIQAEMLVKSLDDAGPDYDKMVNAYTKQDLNALNKFIIDDSELGTNNFMDPLLKDRNERWIDRIAKMSSRQSTFFAVGAGHLPGKDGVIQLLRKQGYTVTPVK